MKYNKQTVDIKKLRTVGDAVLAISEYLQTINGFELPRQQSIQLISYITTLPYILVDEKTPNVLTDQEQFKIITYLDSKPLMPVPYYLGFSVVNGVNINVEKNITLLAGTETEGFISIISCLLPSNRPSIYIDVATGSGVLAICVALLNKKITVLASDISKKALDIAKRNIIKHNLSKRISLFCGSWLSPFLDDQNIQNSIDVISANPPYVKSHHVNSLPKEFADYVPKIAIDGGQDGLTGFRHITEQSCRLLKKNGKLVLQTDEGQTDLVKGIITKLGFYENIETFDGTNGAERFLVAYRK